MRYAKLFMPTRESRSTPAWRASVLLLSLTLLTDGLACRRAWAATGNPPPPTPAAGGTAAQSISPKAAPSNAAAPAASTKMPAASPTQSGIIDERAGVINFLDETIRWFRDIDAEQRFASEPTETLFI